MSSLQKLWWAQRFMELWCDIFSCLVAACLLCGEEQEALNAAVFLHNLKSILDFFFELKSKSDFFQTSENISCSQNFTGLPLPQLCSDHYEAVCIFSISGVLNCFCHCSKIIEHHTCFNLVHLACFYDSLAHANKYTYRSMSKLGSTKSTHAMIQGFTCF